MMKLANNLIKSPDVLAHCIYLESEFLQCIRRQLVEVSQHIQHLQNSDRAETLEMEWLALHLHLSIIKTMISERLEQLNQPTTTNGKYSQSSTD